MRINNAFLKTAVVAVLVTVSFSVLSEARSAKGRALGGVLKAVGKDKTYGKDIIKPDQLRECIILSDKLKKQEEKIGKNGKSIEKNSSSLKKLKMKIDKIGKSLDKKDKEKVNKFNTLVGKYNKLLKTHGNSVDKHNVGISKYNADLRRHKKDCANKKYYKEDHDNVMADLKKKK